MSNRSPMANVRCILIDDADNGTLFGLLGQKCLTLASAVVELYLSDSPGQTKWNKRYCGVVCFVKDNPKRSYFIRLYSIKKRQMLWEQELYTQFRYKTPREFFHTFETENCQAGLNFASEDEAMKFKSAVEKKLTERHQRRVERIQKKRTPGGARQPSHPGVPPPAGKPSGPPPAALTVNIGNGEKNKKKTTKEKGKKEGKLTKADISTPTDFVHVSHVGWDPNKGFDMDKLNPDMKMLFETIGIKTDDPNVDKDTVDFIYDFVGKNGGIDAVREEMKARPPPPPPPTKSTAPPPPVRSTRYPPPPPPSVRAPDPPFVRKGPPPPARIAPKGQVPLPPQPPHSRLGPPPPPPAVSPPRPPVAAPPPPPPAPPIPPTGGPPPPPPPPPTPGINATNGPPVPQMGGRSSDGRGDLLKDLQKGAGHLTKLKPQVEKQAPSEDGDGILGALARALTERQRHIQGSDDEDDDDDDDDDDDWDD